MSYKGRWTATGVMLVSSFIWVLLGLWLLPNLMDNKGVLSSVLPITILIILNALTGWFLGYLFDRVFVISLRDDLTSCYNRRFLLHHVPSVMEAARRRNGSLCFTIIDCDNFKQINDQYGHHIGDKVLRSVSHLLIRNIRKEDYVIRLGGDEFLVIAQHHNPMTHTAIVERLEPALQQLSKDLGIPLSVSTGNVIYPDEAASLDELIHIADLKMYDGKHTKKSAKPAATVVAGL